MDSNYRQNVAAIIINKDKKILMCEHIWIDDAWQLPQGGIEDGETNQEAILRELSEEIGTDKLKVISEMPTKIKYQFPFYLKNKYKFNGQEQTYFLLYYSGDNSDIRFDNQEKPEFKSFEWVNIDEPPKRVVYFKKLAYLEAINHFKKDIEKFNP